MYKIYGKNVTRINAWKIIINYLIYTYNYKFPTDYILTTQEIANRNDFTFCFDA